MHCPNPRVATIIFFLKAIQKLIEAKHIFKYTNSVKHYIGKNLASINLEDFVVALADRWLYSKDGGPILVYTVWKMWNPPNYKKQLIPPTKRVLQSSSGLAWVVQVITVSQ